MTRATQESLPVRFASTVLIKSGGERMIVEAAPVDEDQNLLESAPEQARASDSEL